MRDWCSIIGKLFRDYRVRAPKRTREEIISLDPSHGLLDAVSSDCLYL